MNKVVKSSFSVQPSTLDFSFPITGTLNDGMAKFSCDEISIREDSVRFTYAIDRYLGDKYVNPDSPENRALRIAFAKNFVKQLGLSDSESIDLDEIQDKFREDRQEVRFTVYTY